MNPQKEDAGEIISDDRWSRLHQVNHDTRRYVSKFENNEVSISAERLQSEWDSWSEADKLSFAIAYGFKPEILLEDEKILDFLMAAGDERVWVVIAICLLRHSDKSKVRNFLIERLRSSSEPKMNFIQALSLIGGSEVVSELRRFHDRVREGIPTASKEKRRDMILEFLFGCSGLWKLEDDKAYPEEIESFSNDPDEIVRRTVALLLRGGSR